MRVLGDNGCVKVIDRRWALRGLDVVMAVVFGMVAALPQPGLWTALLVTAAGVALGYGRRGLRRGLAGLTVLVILSLVRAALVDGHWHFVSGELPSALVRAGAPWLLTVAIYLHLQLRQQADKQLEAQRRQHLADLKETSAAERLALAESLHDDLGHALSLVALNLGRLEVDSTLMPDTRKSITTARRDLSTAIERLGDSVVSLRTGSAPEAPDHESTAELIDRARAAGARIEVRAFPGPDRLEHFGIETVNRVLREAITNASKHAPGTVVTIDAKEADDRLRIRVVNAIESTSSEHRTSGTGLRVLGIDLRQRGGELGTRRTPTRFTLHVDIPVHPSAAHSGGPAENGSGTDCDPPPDVRARRGGRRVLTAAGIVIVCALIAVEAITTVHHRRALLSAQTFAQIRVGDTREATMAILPEHELPPRRFESRQDDCHDYAVTADTFDEATGDIYRICFSQDSVITADYIAAETR